MAQLSAIPLILYRDLALNAQLPTVHGGREYVEDGGLMSYGPDISDVFWRAAEFVDQILHGAKPTNLLHPAADQVQIGDQTKDREATNSPGRRRGLSLPGE
jgi:ABC-type uncharacterized transport system substrate-binding protein